MTIVTDADLDAYAALALELALKDDCDILRDSGTPDGQGGLTNVTDQVVATVKSALVDSSRPQEYLLAQQIQGKVFKTALLPRGTAVLKSDRLRIAGVTYHVEDASDPTTYEVLRRVAVWRER